MKLDPATKAAVDAALPKMTIALPFSPEDVRAGRVRDLGREAKFDKAWEIVLNNPELTPARKKLSIHELRHIIRAVAEAFE